MLKNKKALPLIMIFVSAYLTADYVSIVLSGDDSLVRKIALGAWVIQLIVWIYLLIKTVKENKGEKNITG